MSSVARRSPPVGVLTGTARVLQELAQGSRGPWAHGPLLLAQCPTWPLQLQVVMNSNSERGFEDTSGSQ